MNLKAGRLAQILTVCVLVTMLFSCVPARQFEDVKKRESDCRDENAKLKDENQKLTVDNTELKSSSSEMRKDLVALQKDTTELGTAYQRLNGYFKTLNESHDKLVADYEKLLAGNSEETKRLVLQLDNTRRDLDRKEQQMLKDSLALRERERQMGDMNSDLQKDQERIHELESMISKNDSMMNKLKNTVSKALMGYENNGLTIEQKGARIYVSMEEQLLFASGSTNIEKKGENALKDLSKVLASNKDINIMVEGHTDNVPISGTLPSGAKDNWELSVLRATSVVKIILADKSIDPLRVSAAGRGPFQPIDPAGTAEARKKNRRTEIILSPKLDELIKVLRSE
jgi:chemotaxis protein MotB